jgi:hypothetical protein
LKRVNEGVYKTVLCSASGRCETDLTEFLDTFSEDPTKSIYWYEKAETVCKSFTAKTHKKRGVQNHVYIVLLKGVANKKPGYALYVGKTIRKPEVRFQQHKNGDKASKYVKRYGIRLLPELFEHLNPMSGTEATELEVSIAEALKKARIPTYGGH